MSSKLNTMLDNLVFHVKQAERHGGQHRRDVTEQIRCIVCYFEGIREAAQDSVEMAAGCQDEYDSLRRRISASEENYDQLLGQYEERVQDVEDLEKENSRLRSEIKGLHAKLEDAAHRIDRAKSDIDWIDNSTNFLGPLAKDVLQLFEKLEAKKQVFQEMHDAYYAVGQDWPWE